MRHSNSANFVKVDKAAFGARVSEGDSAAVAGAVKINPVNRTVKSKSVNLVSITGSFLFPVAVGVYEGLEFRRLAQNFPAG